MAQAKLVKSGNDRILFGVCGGLAEYFAVDSVFVRLAYIVLALLMPRLKEPQYDPADSIRQNIQGIPSDTAEAGRRIGSVIRGERPEGQHPEPVMERAESRRTAVGIILILIGVIILIVNFGVLGWFNGAIFWPVLLIAVGFGLLAIRVKTS
ncbi:MAG: PspC domain-containing protein [Chloroflexi bacterium]|nr:PspC domain-containing protein [Chloroflexota bacterium]